MFRTNCLKGALLATCAAAALSPPLTVAQDRDSQEVSSHMLTDAGLAKYKQAAIQSAGVTTREYVVFTFSLFHNGMAAWALTQPGGKLPAATSKANVDFYNKHAAELQQLEALKQGDDCDEDQAEDEQEE